VPSESRLLAASERMELSRAFGLRVRDLRTAAGLSVAELAGRCRISPSAISGAEVGRSDPRLSLILFLCDGLGVTPNVLIGDLPVPRERRTR
jgi:transcriptional regulator with XRE-family HTH domain